VGKSGAGRPMIASRVQPLSVGDDQYTAARNLIYSACKLQFLQNGEKIKLQYEVRGGKTI